MKSQKKHTILIVDDNPTIRKLLQDILKDDYQVLIAKDGSQALQISEEHNYNIDLILLDIIMPGISGYEVCKTLKNNPVSQNIPIIFLTIMEADQDEAKGFAIGVNDYIIKPVNRLRLLARVRNQLLMSEQNKLLIKKNHEMQEAIEQIKTLHGILPICSFCKQIRDDKGYWQHVEDYISQRSEAEFSHSICPACVDKHYSDFKD